jgi:hypothetical protein
MEAMGAALSATPRSYSPTKVGLPRADSPTKW